MCLLEKKNRISSSATSEYNHECRKLFFRSDFLCLCRPMISGHWEVLDYQSLLNVSNVLMTSGQSVLVKRSLVLYSAEFSISLTFIFSRMSAGARNLHTVKNGTLFGRCQPKDEPAKFISTNISEVTNHENGVPQKFSTVQNVEDIQC